MSAAPEIEDGRKADASRALARRAGCWRGRAWLLRSTYGHSGSQLCGCYGKVQQQGLALSSLNEAPMQHLVAEQTGLLRTTTKAALHNAAGRWKPASRSYHTASTMQLMQAGSMRISASALGGPRCAPARKRCCALPSFFLVIIVAIVHQRSLPGVLCRCAALGWACRARSAGWQDPRRRCPP